MLVLLLNTQDKFLLREIIKTNPIFSYPVCNKTYANQLVTQNHYAAAYAVIYY